MLEQAWAGVDVGKEHHHCVVIDAEGRRLLSRRVANDEAVLLDLMCDQRSEPQRDHPRVDD